MTPLRLLLMSGGAAAPAVDADAQAWADAVTAAGGTYAAGDLTALNTFIVAAKANSYWTKLTCFGPLLGDQLTAALVQRKSGVWAPATNVNFVSGDYTRATGLTGNGTTKYLNSGLIPSAGLTLNDSHISVYNRASVASSGLRIGAFSGAADTFAIAAPFSDGTCYSDLCNTAGGRLSTALSAPFGFIVGSRTSAGSHVVYRNGSSLASNATSGGGLPNVSMYVCARNNAGNAVEFSTNPAGAYSIGLGLTAGNVTNYNTDIQALMTALGRNV